MFSMNIRYTFVSLQSVGSNGVFAIAKYKLWSYKYPIRPIILNLCFLLNGSIQEIFPLYNMTNNQSIIYTKKQHKLYDYIILPNMDFTKTK